MSQVLRGKTAIVGIGSAGIGEAPGHSAIELLGQASVKAIADAGLKLSDIDAVFAATSSHAFPTLSVCEYLGIRPKFVDGTNIGGSSFELHLLQALETILQRRIEHVVPVGPQRQRRVPSRQGVSGLRQALFPGSDSQHRATPGGWRD